MAAKVDVVKQSFFSRLNLPPCSPTCSGERFRVDFIDSFDDNGIALVKEKGKTDFQSFIDSFFDSVDLYTILSRVLPNVNARDLSSVSVSELLGTYFSNFKPQEGVYADITNFPDNIHEVNKNYVKMCDYFNQLPAEIRLKYHNSVDEFVAGFDDFVKDVSVAIQSMSSVPSAAPSDAPSAAESTKGSE